MDCVIQRLSMKEALVVGANTGRSNIKYVGKPLVSQEELCSELADELLKERTKCVKTVLFCYTLLDCGQIYAKLKRRLGKNITEPTGLPNIIEFRLINLFTAASTAEMKAQVRVGRYYNLCFTIIAQECIAIYCILHDFR